MDDETRRHRRRIAHGEVARRHPYWELLGRPLVVVALVAGLVVVAVLVAWHVVSAVVSAVSGAWPVVVAVLVVLVVLVAVVRRGSSPYRIPRRYR